jgi:hypothetical protein
LVSGCPSEAGGDAAGAGQVESSDREVSEGGPRSGGVSGPQSGGVLGGGDVPDVAQGLGGPVPSGQTGELSRAGLLGSEAGDRVDGLEADLPGPTVDAAADDLNGLAGAGEEQVVDRAYLQPADPLTAVTGRTGPVLQWDPRPGKEPLVSAALFEMRDEWIALPRRHLPEGDTGDTRDIYRKISFGSSVLPNAPKCNRQLITNTMTRDTAWRMRVPDRVALASISSRAGHRRSSPQVYWAVDLRVSW